VLYEGVVCGDEVKLVTSSLLMLIANTINTTIYSLRDR